MALPPIPPKIETDFKESARQMITMLGKESVTIKVREQDGQFISYGPFMSAVSAYRFEDLVAGSTLKVGDFKCILISDDLTFLKRRLQPSDRIQWRGREYAVIAYDDATGSGFGNPIITIVALRG